MRLIFISNYFNHHQKSISDIWYEKFGNDYIFIETKNMDSERKNMGWEMNEFPPYVISPEEFYSKRKFYQTAINNAQVVIIGSAPNELVRNRIEENKLTFRYSERPLKKGLEPFKYLYRLLKMRKLNPMNKKLYMLCASAYTATDYAKFGLFKNKCFKWGYFPEAKKYENIEKLIERKIPNSIIWVARFIDWKHPEIAVEIAKRLKNDGYYFQLNMIGNGDLKEQINELIIQNNLTDCVHLLGVMRPSQVREYMEKSQIHIFTSDRQEGWGAVLNESMNSACAVIANGVIGAVPFLIKNKENGLIYQDKNIEDLYCKVRGLLDDMECSKKLGKNAYKSICEEWNPNVAAERFVDLSIRLLLKEQYPEPYTSGPCSKAE